MKTKWICPFCIRRGEIEHQKERSVISFCEDIQDDHHKYSPDCDGDVQVQLGEIQVPISILKTVKPRRRQIL